MLACIRSVCIWVHVQTSDIFFKSHSNLANSIIKQNFFSCENDQILSEVTNNLNKQDIQIPKWKYKMCWSDHFKAHCGELHGNITWENKTAILFQQRLTDFPIEMWLINNFASDGGCDRPRLLSHAQTELQKQWPENNTCAQINFWKTQWKTWLSLNTASQKRFLRVPFLRSRFAKLSG